MRKPRSDSKLMTLPEEQQSELAEWMLSGVPYHKIQQMLEKEFKVKTSMGALSNFWDDYCAAELVRRRSKAVSLADEVAAEVERNPGRFDDATIDALQQKAFELAISPGSNPKDVKALFSLVLKAKDQDLAEQQLALRVREFEQKIADAEAQLTKAKKDGGLDVETIEKIEEALGLL